VPAGLDSPFSTAARIEASEPPAKARSPVIISCSTAPKLKMSLRASAGWAWARSGDMQATVPTANDSSGRAIFCSAAAHSAVIAKRPKSTTLICPGPPAMMLPGLRWR